MIPILDGKIAFCDWEREGGREIEWMKEKNYIYFPHFRSTVIIDHLLELISCLTWLTFRGSHLEAHRRVDSAVRRLMNDCNKVMIAWNSRGILRKRLRNGVLVFPAECFSTGQLADHNCSDSQSAPPHLSRVSLIKLLAWTNFPSPLLIRE